MNEISDNEILQRWYRYAAEQHDSVDSFLRLLREREGKSLKAQQAEFEATSEAFLHLRSMRLPRAKSFAKDAQRIAEACHIGNPFAFVRAMLLARDLSKATYDQEAGTSYKAAFDAIEGLDDQPDEE